MWGEMFSEYGQHSAVINVINVSMTRNPKELINASEMAAGSSGVSVVTELIHDSCIGYGAIEDLGELQSSGSSDQTSVDRRRAGTMASWKNDEQLVDVEEAKSSGAQKGAPARFCGDGLRGGAKLADISRPHTAPAPL